MFFYQSIGKSYKVVKLIKCGGTYYTNEAMPVKAKTIKLVEVHHLIGQSVYLEGYTGKIVAFRPNNRLHCKVKWDKDILPEWVNLKSIIRCLDF